jgi:hypothetical protein
MKLCLRTTRLANTIVFLFFSFAACQSRIYNQNSEIASALPKVEQKIIQRTDESLGVFSWGINPKTQKAWTESDLKSKLNTSKDNLSKVLKLAVSFALNETNFIFEAVPKLEIEGYSANHVRMHRSTKVILEEMPRIFAMSVCARSSGHLECEKKAKEGILKWSSTYIPSGNPIDENNLIPLLESIDLMWLRFSEFERLGIKKWLVAFLQANEKFLDRIPLNSTSHINSHEIWRIAIRAYLAMLLEDGAEFLRIKERFEEHVGNQIAADGSTYDFHQRDSLHFQVFSLKAYTKIALHIPLLYTDRSKEHVSKAFQFLMPYYLKKKTHIDFAKSTNRFDIERKNSEHNRKKDLMWTPGSAREVLRLARPTFPQIKNWSQDVVDNQYPLRVRLLAALLGE